MGVKAGNGPGKECKLPLLGGLSGAIRGSLAQPRRAAAAQSCWLVRWRSPRWAGV